MENLQEPMLGLGTTPPISLSFPTADELVRDSDLLQYLTERDDVIEDRHGNEKRLGIVRKVTEMLQQWAAELLLERGVPTSIAANGGGVQLKLFGSTRLGVNAPDADIDCLCIAPEGITREDFFKSFGSRLGSRMDVEGVFPVPEAYTPVLKFIMDDQPVDMIFVALTTCPIPESFNILELKNITGMEEQDIRSLNGSRVAECIFASVPNIPCFCCALRCIKHWARQRGIYSNILGFLSGCSCAIMVAFVCQRFPHACAATIVENFFLIFSHWVWSPVMPVLLGNIETRDFPQTVEEILSTSSTMPNKYIRVWNPKLNPGDGLQLMPIITPAYPAMNASYNVGPPQFRRIQEEIQRAQFLIQSAYLHHAALSSVDPTSMVRINWKELFCGFSADYFSSYSRFIRIDVSATSDEHHRFWFGWCESKLRQFILTLEKPPNIFCHPQSNWYHQRSQQLETIAESSVDNDTAEGCSTPQHGRSGSGKGNGSSTSMGPVLISSFFIGLSFVSGLASADLTAEVDEFLRSSSQWGGKKPDMKAVFTHLKRHEIPAMVHSVRAEPSSVSSCTPRKTKYSHPSGVSSSNLEPSGRDKDTDQAVFSLSSSLHHSYTDNERYPGNTIEDDSAENVGDDLAERLAKSTIV